MKLFKEKFLENIPEGILYYPCAGGDTKIPIDLFGELVSEVHFSDINRVILPYVECGVTKKININGKWQRVVDKSRRNERQAVGVYGTDRVIKAQREKVKRNLDIGGFLRGNFNCNVGDIRVNDIREIEKWKINNSNKDVTIVAHCLDGVLTLLLLNKISVFFYRNDTCDYEGTNQLWYSREVFDNLLDKLVDGALVVTDGSNYNPYDMNVPWQVFWNKELEVKDFEYKNCTFKYLGEYEGEERNPVGIWKVNKFLQ